MENKEKALALAKEYTRQQLNELAIAKGIINPERFLNKSQIAQAIAGVKTVQMGGKADASQLLNFEMEGTLTAKEADSGISNAPAMELDEDSTKEILEKQQEGYSKAEKLKDLTRTYENGFNLWKVISSATNEPMAYSFKTLAMAVGTRGVLVCTIERDGQKAAMSTIYIDNGKLVDVEGKWRIK